MEPVPLDALRVVAARNGHQFGHRWHPAVKCGVEAGHLHQLWIAVTKGLNQSRSRAADDLVHTAWPDAIRRERRR